ncbi:hypothetical protein D3C74_379120 [compost metagenome]
MNSQRHIHGMMGNLKIQAVFEQSFELNPQQSAFGKQATFLFDHITKIWFERIIQDHDRFSHQRSNLGSADVKYIAQARKISKCHIAITGGKCISKACSIHEKWQTTCSADCVQCLQFCFAVHRSVLRWLRYIDHTWLYTMFR